jgi:hypothetical protein
MPERKIKPKGEGKVLGGPNSRASSASGAKNMRATIPRVPATNEPMAETARAAPASLPGHLIAVDGRHHRGGLSGTLTRMLVVEPPYMEP